MPVDRATLEQIADETGGSYSEAASAAELEQVYADLGSQIGYTTEPQDISPWFVRGGVLVAFLGVVLSACSGPTACCSPLASSRLSGSGRGRACRWCGGRSRSWCASRTAVIG